MLLSLLLSLGMADAYPSWQISRSPCLFPCGLGWHLSRWLVRQTGFGLCPVSSGLCLGVPSPSPLYPVVYLVLGFSASWVSLGIWAWEHCTGVVAAWSALRSEAWVLDLSCKAGDQCVPWLGSGPLCLPLKL